MADALPPIEVDPKFAKVIDPASPLPMRMMAARGIVPGAKPADVLLIQYALSLDPDEKIASSAKTAIAATPANLVKGAVDAKTHPGVIDVIARGTQDPDLLEFLILRKQVLDDTLVHLGETSTSLNVVEIIGKNQERLLQNPKILDALKKNPISPKSLIDVTVTFLQMAGVLPTGIEARVAGLPEKIDQKMVEAVLASEEFEESLTAENGGEMKEGDDKEKTLLQRLSAMTVAQKVKLAFFANKETRAILVRETNRVVVSAVLNSGRLSEPEVVMLSRNKSVSTDVLREIAKNKDWTKNYLIQEGLASNPKTPRAVAMGMIKFLRTADLSKLAKNSNVPSDIRSAARALFEQKSAHR